MGIGDGARILALEGCKWVAGRSWLVAVEVEWRGLPMMMIMIQGHMVSEYELKTWNHHS